MRGSSKHGLPLAPVAMKELPAEVQAQAKQKVIELTAYQKQLVEDHYRDLHSAGITAFPGLVDVVAVDVKE